MKKKIYNEDDFEALADYLTLQLDDPHLRTLFENYGTVREIVIKKEEHRLFMEELSLLEHLFKSFNRLEEGRFHSLSEYIEYIKSIRSKSTMEIYLICLSKDNELLKLSKLFEGDNKSVFCYNREIAKEMFKYDAARAFLILSDPQNYFEDNFEFKRAKKVLQEIGLTITEMILISKEESFSYL